MSLDQLRKEIRHEAESQRKHALAEAKKQADAILAEAEQQAKALVQKAKADAALEAEGKLTQVSAARLKAKKRIAEARDHLVQQQLQQARQALAKFADSPKYAGVLKKLADEAAEKIGKNAQLFAREKDVPKLKKMGYSAEEMDCLGGCVAATPDGRIRVNNTLEALFEENEEKLRQKIFEEL
ncbi:hypothetical protein HY572_06045 [Candidatus Micrarchaeota archaeon]|nr:hypothetical protein [Candidatus Micrarchaeota archaeon]